MKQSNLLLSFLFVITSISAQQVVINELQVWPVNDTYGEVFSEYIELTNAGTETANLEGWTISTNSGSAVISGVSIDPDGYAIFAISDNENLNLGLEVDFDWGFSAGIEPNNTSDNIFLTDAEGSIVDSVGYNSTDWPIEQGKSMELINTLYDNNDADHHNWW